MSASSTRPRYEGEELARLIRDSHDSARVVETVLTTDERVLARVTDGIYRQPGSALRELVANAYDADAGRVQITTDRPRFDRIRIDDDGLGMAPEVLAHVLTHIGGSAKRNTEGAALGITSSTDTKLSPGGRRLIGKVGIGLFSVSQLTQDFQMITKVAGDEFRTVARVILKQYSDESRVGEEREQYEAGLVNIWREPATDLDSHGTSIILNGIRPQTRQTMRSEQVWAGIERNEELTDPSERQDLRPPTFHIGRVLRDDEDALRDLGDGRLECVPWEPGDDPAIAFTKLVEALWDEEYVRASQDPKLDRILDEYLQMVWQLSLSIPLAYVDEHPFDIAFNDHIYARRVPNTSRAPIAELKLKGTQTLRENAELGDVTPRVSGFDVYIDDLKLARPLKFTGLPTTGHILKKPIIFVGDCEERFDEVAPELSGGTLRFQAYLMWAPKIVPVEHQGALVRIHGASGTLFDSTFMRYQISERSRLRQTTCEIFVSEGLEGALNIDRESFNFAHPHVVFLTNWLHNALRRLHTTQKSLASSARGERRADEADEADRRLDDIVSETWAHTTGDTDLVPPEVSFGDTDQPTIEEGTQNADRYKFDRRTVFDDESGQGRWASSVSSRRVERQLKAIVRVLSAYEFFGNLSVDGQTSLIRSVRRILEVDQ